MQFKKYYCYKKLTNVLVINYINYVVNYNYLYKSMITVKQI